MGDHILSDEAEVEKGENARMSSFVGAIAIADLVKSTLGPKGMDKILQSASSRDHKIEVTNDGATILKSVHVENAAAKILVDIAKTQDEEIGDGTTSVAVLCGELLREAEKLVDARIHPQTIAAGWRLAAKIAKEDLDRAAVKKEDDASFEAELVEVAKTTLSSKLVLYEKEHFARLAVDAVLRLHGSDNLDYIQVLKKPGGSLKDSFLAEGFVLDKKIGIGQPKRVENAKVLVANTPMDTDKIKIYGARVKVESLSKVAEIEQAEKDKMAHKVARICDHGINVFINRQLIYNYPEELFAKRGVMAIEHADFEGVERLAAVLGADICSTFERPDLATLGTCDLVDEVMIGEDKLIRFSGCKSGEACTIVLRGASTHVLDEAERSLHDALCVLTRCVADTRTVPGGGCTEVRMARAIDLEAPNIPGKKALAMEAFARALRAIPAIIADNGGYDSSELVSRLRAAHAAGKNLAGLDMTNGDITLDITKLGVRESAKSKQHVLSAAAEAAEMILRVDDIIKCAPRKREEEQY
ncbi:hypothetical protein CTAYLR_000860 [Chrysophaeum taylorii]|uniref:CCT-beta n=1 Tax=Chrysophaeum taylorii TaxID=2483200 RepID=A0AAD7UQ25_9STRA|nr:hypothetical protein CTAYLR_000860 [Chrysophaeum taylorii]